MNKDSDNIKQFIIMIVALTAFFLSFIIFAQLAEKVEEETDCIITPHAHRPASVRCN